MERSWQRSQISRAIALDSYDSMPRFTVTNVGGFRIPHRRSIEYPGFVLPACIEPGEQCAIMGEPMVVKHKHTDGHLYDIYFYRLQKNNLYVYVCDFVPDYPSQRSLICEGRCNDLLTTTIINVGSAPFAFRATPAYPGSKLTGFLEKGESAEVFSEFRVIPYLHKDAHVYCIHFYKLVDNSGWIPDFDPDHPEKRTMHDKAGFPLEEMRILARNCGLREVQHDTERNIFSFANSDNIKILAYYATGTVITSMHHPRQGITQLIRRNQTMDGLREIFQHPAVYPEIGYEGRGRKKIISSPGAKNSPAKQSSNARLASPSRSGLLEEVVDEEEAIKRQLRRIELEAKQIDIEKQRLTTALESYQRHRNAERRRERDREVRIAQQQKAMSLLERNTLRGTEMVCHTSNNTFVHRHWAPNVCSVALGVNCEMIMYDDGAMACSNPDGLPSDMLASITDREKHTVHPPRYCALGSNGRYFVAYGTNMLEREWVAGDSFSIALQSLAAREAPKRGSPPNATGQSVIKSVSFGESMDSWVILLVDGTCLYNYVPASLEDMLVQGSFPASAPTTGDVSFRVGGRGDLEEVSLGPKGEWFLLRSEAKTGIWESRSSKFLNAAKAIKTKITAIYFGAKGTYLIRHK